MNRKVAAVLSAVVTLLVFTVLPLYAQSLLPSELGMLLNQVGFDLTGFLNQIALIGVVVAFLSVAKGFVYETSPLNLLLSIASSVMTLGITLVTLSLGDIGNLGITMISMKGEGGSNTMILDLRLFIQLAVLTVALKVVHSVLKFMGARTETASAEPHQLADTG